MDDGLADIAGRGAAALDGDRSQLFDGRVARDVELLFVVFLLLPWGNATFLMAIATLFAWIAAAAARLRAPYAEP